MKSKNTKCKKSWVDPGAPFTLTATPNRFGRKTMLCVWWDQGGVVYYELLKPTETVNTKRYQRLLTDLNRSLFEKARVPKETTQSHFSSWPCSITHGKTGSRHVGGIQLESYTSCGLLTRLGSFRLPLVSIDGSYTCWATVWFARRCEKMTQWMVRIKREILLLAWYSQITRKMGKMDN